MADLIQQLLISDSDEDDFKSTRRSFTRKNFIELYDEGEFKKRFRMNKMSAVNIIQEIEDILEYPSDRNDAISPMNQLLLTLRYFATGSFSLTVGDYLGVSKSSANRIIRRVSRALCSLREKHIKFPSSDEELTHAQILNYSVASFSRVLGMIDCTHIKIQSPGGPDAELFRNRKGYFSLNVQVICNANLEINDIVARWPGSAHDSTIFNGCYRKAMLEDGRYGNGMLLGDSGYPLLPYLMTPIETPITQTERIYNESHIRTRNCIERLFGVWKRRFPVLAVGMNLHLENIFPVVVATAILHNILRKENDPPPDDANIVHTVPWDELLSNGQMPTVYHRAPERPGLRMRNILLGEYFNRL